MTATEIHAALEEVACAVCGGTDTEPARLRTARDPYAQSLGLDDGRSSWVVCRSCALVYQSPRPNAQAVDEMYTGGEYHRERGGIPDHYVDYSLRRSQLALNWALTQMGATSATAGDALDIGAGIGGALVHLRNHGWSTIGVEPDGELAAFGRDRFDLDIRDGFFDDATFADGTRFDFAYSCHVWEHLTDPVAVAKAARAVLRPGGHLCIVVPTFREAKTMAWQCFSTPHNYMFTHTSLGNVLALAGFDVVTHAYESDGDSELWLLAKVRDSDTALRTDEDVDRVQREIAMVPLRVPLGLPHRLRKHAATLTDDPADFAQRALRRVGELGGRLRRAARR